MQQVAGHKGRPLRFSTGYRYGLVSVAVIAGVVFIFALGAVPDVDGGQEPGAQLLPDPRHSGQRRWPDLPLQR